MAGFVATDGVEQLFRGGSSLTLILDDPGTRATGRHFAAALKRSEQRERPS